MKNYNNLFLGLILICLGVFTLGIINQWVSWDVSLIQIAKFWPLLIILAGVAVMLDKRRSAMNATSIILILLAIPLGVYNCASPTYNKIENTFNKKFEFDIDTDDFTYEEGMDSTSSNAQTLKVENNPAVEYVDLDINGGAIQFILDEPTTTEMFWADTRNLKGSFYSIKDEISGVRQKIKFKMKSNSKIKWNKREGNRKVNLRLNEKPIWNINMEVGAGDVQYNLAPYKIEKLEIEAGASNLNLKLGDKLSESKIDIESGAANIAIEIPENVGCEVKFDGALSSKSFDGFNEVKSGTYRTPNFDSATKKIYIKSSSGLSNIKIIKY